MEAKLLYAGGEGSELVIGEEDEAFAYWLYKRPDLLIAHDDSSVLLVLYTEYPALGDKLDGIGFTFLYLLEESLPVIWQRILEHLRKCLYFLVYAIAAAAEAVLRDYIAAASELCADRCEEAYGAWPVA